jgi:hypothetical protein
MGDPKPDLAGGPRAGGVSRYPGVQPFGDGEMDRRLFRGRDREKYELLQLVMAERLVLVFARSGIGKTSLLNAGLLEPLRGEGYFPLAVRIGASTGSPLDSVYEGIRTALDAAGARGEIEYEPSQAVWNSASLWHFFKMLEIWRGDRLLSPVLLIDQFEELFTLHDPAPRKAFIDELADLVRGTRPRRPLDGTGAKLSDTPPEVKVVLALREDFYANLEELRDRIPSIYKAPFRVKPLSREQARRAIVEPAALQDAAFATPAFAWADDALELVLDFLSEQQLGGGRTRVGKEVEPFQLQLICGHVEDKVRRDRLATLTAADLGGADALKSILSSFYEESLRKVCDRFPDDPRLRERLERLCEYGFITAKGRRLLREESTIKQDDGVPPEVLQELVQHRVLRKEPRVGDNYYELTHDTLIEPIQLSRQAREARKRAGARRAARRRIALAGLAMLAMLVSLGGWALWERAEVQRVAEAKRHAVVAQEKAELQAQQAARETDRALAAERQALEERQASVEVAAEARRVAAEQAAQRRQAQAESRLAAIQPLAVAAQKKVAEARLQADEAKGQAYQQQAEQLLAQAQRALHDTYRRLEIAQREIVAAHTGVSPGQAAGEATDPQASAATGYPEPAAEPPAAKMALPADIAAVGSDRQASETPERRSAALLAALLMRETDPEVTDGELADSYRELLQAGDGLGAEQRRLMEGRLAELEDSAQAFTALKRRDDSPDSSVCEAFDAWTAYRPRRVLGPEAEYRDLRLVQLDALLKDNAGVTTQDNFITSRGEDDHTPQKTFTLGAERVYVHAWVNAPRGEAVRLTIRQGDVEEPVWEAKRVQRNPLRGKRQGYHLWTYKGANSEGLHELRLYNAKDLLICRREFVVVPGGRR